MSKSNPKNFRNGDVIKVSSYEPGMTATSSFVYVKFGENYYNLSQGGQMKACRYLPPGKKEVITNLSGMGRYFLMDEKELEEAASTATSSTEGRSSIFSPEELERLLQTFEQTKKSWTRY